MPNSKVRVYFCFVVLLGSNLCSRNSNGLKFHWFFKSSSTKYLSPIGKLSDLTNFKTKVFKNVWLLQHLSCRKRLGTVVLQQRAQQFIFYRNIPLFHTVQEYIVVFMRKCRWLGQQGVDRYLFLRGFDRYLTRVKSWRRLTDSRRCFSQWNMPNIYSVIFTTDHFVNCVNMLTFVLVFVFCISLVF